MTSQPPRVRPAALRVLAGFALWLASLLPPSAPAQSTAANPPASAAAPARYRYVKDIPYRTDAALDAEGRARCRVDVYHPEGRRDVPTVVWFHGGGLTGGERAVPRELEEQGLIVVAAGYRLSPRVQAPTYIEDAAAAVAWTFRHITEYGGATNRIFVSGHSAGGYLTCMLGLDKRWLAAHGIDANAIAGLLPCSAQCITHFTIRAERHIPEKQPIIDDLAPLYHVRADAPPLLLITGDRERELLGRYEENAYLWRMMKIAGHSRTELHELPGFDHGGMVHPGLGLVLQFVRQNSR